jgi:hypothetical protein
MIATIAVVSLLRRRFQRMYLSETQEETISPGATLCWLGGGYEIADPSGFIFTPDQIGYHHLWRQCVGEEEWIMKNGVTQKPKCVCTHWWSWGRTNLFHVIFGQDLALHPRLRRGSRQLGQECPKAKQLVSGWSLFQVLAEVEGSRAAQPYRAARSSVQKASS